MSKRGRTAVEVGALCDFINGNGFRPPEWRDSGLPIIRIQNLNGSRDFNFFDGTPLPHWIVEPGDLLFAWAGVKGVSFGPTIWSGPRGVLNQHIFRVIPKKGVDKYWLFAALQLITSRVEAQAHGFKASLVHVHKADITSQLVDVPTLSEQRRIAVILGTWDVAIGKAERIVHMSADLLQKLKASVFAEDGSEKLVRFSDFLSESRIPGSDGSSARKITVKLYGKGATAKEEKRIGSANTKYYMRRSGHLIFSRLDFLNGAFAIVPPELDGYESTLDLPAFDISDVVDPTWLIHFLTRPCYYQAQTNLARGQRKARRVNPNDLLLSSLPLPPRKRQEQVAATLTLCEAQLKAARSLAAAIRAQKNCLMEKLLTGGVRLREAAAAELSPAAD